MSENRFLERKALFRKEVMHELANRSHGEALTSTPWRVLTLTVFFTMFVLLLIAFVSTFAIKDSTPVRGLLNPTVGVTKIYPTRNGIVGELRVSDGESVAAGQILVVINTGNFDRDGGESIGDTIALLKRQRAGIVAQVAVEEALAKNNTEDLSVRIGGAERELTIMQQDRELLEERLTLAHDEFENTLDLVQRRLMSAEQSNAKKSAFLNARQQLNGLDARIEAQINRINELRQQLQALPLNAKARQLNLESNLVQIDLRIAEIENNGYYSLVAPRDGKITLLNASVGDHVRPNTPLLTLLPIREALEANLYIPTTGAGSLAQGQGINIIYDAFPAETYGSYQGEIISISEDILDPREHLLPISGLQEPVYQVKVKLEKQSVRGGNEEVPLQSGMQLTAHITTQERTILQRIFSPVTRTGSIL